MPADIPVTRPVVDEADDTVAMPGALELHIKEATTSLNVIVLPVQNGVLPVIVAGIG